MKATKGQVAKQRILDDFSTPEKWLPVASGEALMQIRSEKTAAGHALRLDFDFKGGGGFVVARREFAMKLPESFAFGFRIRGKAPRNKLEFKLADPSGHNVWRWQQEKFNFTEKPCGLHLKNSAIEFAWGPAGGGSPRQLGAVEFVISAGPGGKGTVWIEDFTFEDRTIDAPPLASASSSRGGRAAAAVLTKSPRRGWSPAANDARPWLQVDFHAMREYGGLVIDWEASPARRKFSVKASDDGHKWRVLAKPQTVEGPRSFVALPRAESRFLRLCFEGQAAMRRLELRPWDFTRTPVDFCHAVAAASPRGRHPRYLLREQSYWTCAGSPDGLTCALINEEGMVEPDKGSFSLEPFLTIGGRFITWADARRSVRLEPGGVPIPTAVWKLPAATMETTAFATGAGNEVLRFIRYRVTNHGGRALRAKLHVALRPYQVTPPWQAWNGLGGVSEIRGLRWTKGAVVVNGERLVVPLQAPANFAAAAFGQGVISDILAEGRRAGSSVASDPSGLASAAMSFDLRISAGGFSEVFVVVPTGTPRDWPAAKLGKLASISGPDAFDQALDEMRRRVSAVEFSLPAGFAREAAETFRSAIGQILVNRDGPALQPGPRRYTRSWIRDGAIMGAALLRAGDRSALPDFIRWFAPWQRRDGFVPCCVDRNGADWLVEHDSHGQLIYGVMESFRFSRDSAWLLEMWPHVRKAARFIRKLRASRLTREYHKPALVSRRGLLPESASHEGYLAHPVHAYWDDFWALRGLQDAAEIAGLLGKDAERKDFAAESKALRKSLRESIERVIAEKQLAYIPGSVEWADFDPTATANAVSLLHADSFLPPGPLQEMFAHFVRDFRRKHRGEMPWNNYTAYEIRIIGALVRLGQRAEALELLEFFLGDKRPRRWNQWPEISWKDPRSPGHLGDVPHTWIASEYLLVFASLFAYEREQDDALILAAGLDERWLASRGGVSVRGLPVWHGALDFSLKQQADGSLHCVISGNLRPPRGGFILRPPRRQPIRKVRVNGRSIDSFTASEVTVRGFPASIIVS